MQRVKNCNNCWFWDWEMLGNGICDTNWHGKCRNIESKNFRKMTSSLFTCGKWKERPASCVAWGNGNCPIGYPDM